MKKGLVIGVVLVVILMISGVYFFISGSLSDDFWEEYCFNEITGEVQSELFDLIDCENTPECPEGASCESKCWGGDIRIGLLPSKNYIELKEGDECGVAFAVKNILNETKIFSYNISIDDPSISEKCGSEFVRAVEEMDLGNGESLEVFPGEIVYDILKIEIPEGEFSCIFRVRLFVWAEGELYGTEFLDVIIE